MTTTDRITELDGFNVLVRGRDALYIANRNDIFVGRALCLYGEYAEEEYRVLDTIAQPGCVVVDVGANLGTHAVRLAKKVGLGGRVIAVEPQPPLFQAMAGTMAINGLMNVDCWPYILSDAAGRTVLPALDYRAENNFGGIGFQADAEAGIVVPKVRFDDVFHLPRLNLMKIDVEGMELDVLHGAEASIAAHRPALYLENDRSDASPALLQWLFDADYRVWWHFPKLFNPQNAFGNTENIYGSAVSMNVLAMPKEATVQIDWPEATDANWFPQLSPMASAP